MTLFPILSYYHLRFKEYQSCPFSWHPILDVSKNVQISIVSEFDELARFREMIPTVKSVSSSEI